MAKPNDMPEFHSVKVSLTENIPVLRYPPFADASNTIAGNLTFSSSGLIIRGGKYHV